MILLSLAITDFTAGILAQPLHIARLAVLATKGHSPFALDIATVAIGYTLPATSFFTVSYVTLERFLAIFYPFYHERRCTSKISLKMVLLIWIIGVSYGAVGCLPYKQTRLAFIIMVTVIGTFFLLWNSFSYSKIFIISRKIIFSHTRSSHQPTFFLELYFWTQSRLQDFPAVSTRFRWSFGCCFNPTLCGY